jgi:hypothetical protein
MTTLKLSGLWVQRPLLFRYLSILCCLCATMFTSNSAFSQLQPADCHNVQCTSSDVQVISAYISAPDNMPIDCGSANPFLNAELHLIVSSNTQRIGVSLSGNLNTTNGNTIVHSYPIGHCFTDITLNNGGNNNLVYDLGTILSGVQCGPGFDLANLFISWGTGNSNFCDLNPGRLLETDPNCPATPAKCRFVPGETIPVTVKLDVDFTFVPGVCSEPQGNSLAVDFTPDITATGLTPDFTYTWDFGDNSSEGPTVVSNLSDIGATSHTYAAAGTYTVTLTVSDNSQPVVTKTAIHIFTLSSCCNLATPTVTKTPPTCTSATTVQVDNPVSGVIYRLSNLDNTYTADNAGSFSGVVPGTYSLSSNKGDCSADGDDVVVQAQLTSPDKPEATPEGPGCGQTTGTVTVTDPVDGVTYTLTKGATVLTADDKGVFLGVAPGTYTFSASNGTCSANGDDVVVDNAPVVPGEPTSSDQSRCGPGTVELIASGCDGGTITWYDKDGIKVGEGSPFTTSSLSATTTFFVTCKQGICESASTEVKAIINDIPTVGAGSDVSICNGGSTTLTATGASSYSWSPATGLSATTGSSVTANPTSTTTYTVTGTDANTCSNTAQVKVTVNPVPSCTISNTSNAGSHTAGVGQAVNFSGPSGSGFAYTWSFASNSAGATFSGGAATSTSQTVTVTTTTTGSYMLSLKVTDNTYATKCYATCTYAVTVNTSNAYYTVTQGFYGNVGGKICTPSGGLFTAGTKGNVDGLIAASIKNMPSQKLFLGLTVNNRTFTMTATSAEEKNLILYMPATQTSTVITANSGSNNNTNITSNLPKLNSKKISDILLGQTITLALNVYIPGNTLASFVMQTGYLTTQKADIANCPVKNVLPCSKDAASIGSLQIATSAGMKTWIAGKTVADLLILASNALGGGALPSGVTLSDINNAVDVINRSFDGGRFFLGYFSSPKTCGSTLAAPVTNSTGILNEQSITVNKLSVSAYPNPFTDKVKFEIASPVSGKASLDVYNVMGQKLQTIFQGYLFAGTKKLVEYNVPSSNKGSLLYTLKIGDQHVTGKVVQIK